MARGDWSAGQQRIAVTVPLPLKRLIESIQKTHCFDSESALIRHLIETHPMVRERVDTIAREAYGSDQTET
jgi:argonaute-like protein implicated in RNA metabolism and viral defense